MLFAHKETVEGVVVTLVVAASTTNEYNNFNQTQVSNFTAGSHNFFNTVTESDFMDHLTDDLYRGYEETVFVYSHSNEDEQNSFFDLHKIEEVGHNQGRDKQRNMKDNDEKELDKIRHDKYLEAKKIAEETGQEIPEELREKTISEQYGLDKKDQWDKSGFLDNEEQTAQLKQLMNDKIGKGELTSNSFDGVDVSAQEKKKRKEKQDVFIERVSNIADFENLKLDIFATMTGNKTGEGDSTNAGNVSLNIPSPTTPDDVVSEEDDFETALAKLKQKDGLVTEDNTPVQTQQIVSVDLFQETVSFDSLPSHVQKKIDSLTKDVVLEVQISTYKNSDVIDELYTIPYDGDWNPTGSKIVGNHNLVLVSEVIRDNVGVKVYKKRNLDETSWLFFTKTINGKTYISVTQFN